MKQIVIISTAIALTLTSQLVAAAPITDNYADGDPLTATTMNNIKAAVNDNDTNVGTNATAIGTKQNRVSGTCPAGESIRVINVDGTVTCEVDDVGGGSSDGHSLDAADGSPVDALFVDIIGNVGIGTTTPASPLTITGSNALIESHNTIGNMRWRLGTDSDNTFIINKTTGTTFSPFVINDSGRAFFTRNSANTIPATPCTTVTINNSLPGISGCIEGLMIGSSLGGAVFIGHDTNANQRLTLGWIGSISPNRGRLDTVGGALVLQDSSGENVGISDTTPSTKLEVNGIVTASGFVTVSDGRMKKNVKPIESPLTKISKLNGVTYEWDKTRFLDRNLADGNQIGLIAQEVIEVMPEAVRGSAEDSYSVNYTMMIPLLIEALKEQQHMIDSLRLQLQEASKSD